MDTQINKNDQNNIQLYRVVKVGQLLHQHKWLTSDQVQQKFPHVMEAVGHGIPPQHVLGLKAEVLVKDFVRLCELRAQSVKYRLSHRAICPKVL